MIARRFAGIPSALGLLALCAQLHAETMFIILKDQPQQEVAARLKALGADDIQQYTVVNMLRATMPASVAAMVRRDPAVAAMVEAGGNAGVIDRIEQFMNSSPGAGLNETVFHGTESFARLIDLIAAEHDIAIFSSGDFDSSNTVRASSGVQELETALDGVAQNRHIATRALAENAAAGNPGGASPALATGSVSSEPGSGFRFFKVSDGSPFHATLAWDRHFTADFQPYRRQLGTFLYRATDGTIAADAAGELVLKVKLMDNAGSPAGDEAFALAISRPGLEPVKGPALDLRCSHGGAVLNCTVKNTGDLPVFGVKAHLQGTEYAAGKIEAGGSRMISVRANGYDPGDPRLTVDGNAFGEVIQADAVSGGSTPPDPPQLSLSCAYTTQSSSATVITCTVTGAGQIPFSSVTVIASASGGPDYRQVPVGSLSGGATAQAVYTYTSGGFVGAIWALGVTDQGSLLSNTLEYPVANQPPTPGPPATCSSEGAIPDSQPYPVTAGGGNVTVKTQPGCKTVVSLVPGQLTGLSALDYGGGVGSRTATFLLGENIVTDASTPDRSWYLEVNVSTTHILVTQAGQTCSFQPVASLLTVPASGYTGTITMSAGPNCRWDQVADSLGLHFFGMGPPPFFPPPATTTGPGTIQYMVDGTNSLTDQTLTGYVGGQLITIVQRGNASASCSYSAAATGSLQVAYSGGGGGINISGSPSTCASSISSSSNWISFAGSSSGSGNWNATYAAAANVQLNASSPQRTASVVVSAPASGSGTPFSQSFTVTQAGLQCTFTPPAKPFTVPTAGIPQSSPQSFMVTVSNPGCRWTATSGSPGVVTVVNSGVIQTSATTYTVQYWAMPGSNTTTPSMHIQLGDQTYDGIYIGSDDITVTTTDQSVGDGDNVQITWTFGTNPGTDDVTVTIKYNSKTETTNNLTNAGQGHNLPLPPKGTKWAYEITVTDNTSHKTGTKTVNLTFPQIVVTSADAMSQSSPGNVTWQVVPAGADIGPTVKILMTRPPDKPATLASAAPNNGTAAIKSSSVFGLDPGAGYTLSVASNVLNAANAPKWSGSKVVSLSGVSLVSPTTSGGVIPVENGSIHVVYNYFGKAVSIKFTVTDVDDKPKGTTTVAIGGNGRREADVPIDKGYFGAMSKLTAETVATPTQPSDEDEAGDLTLAGIAIPDVSSVSGAITINFTASGAAALGDKFQLSVSSGGHTYSAPSKALVEGANSATVRVPAGAAVYKISVKPSKVQAYTGVLNVTK